VNTSSPPACGGTSHLTEADQRLVAEALKLATLRTTADIQQRFPGWGDSTAAAYAEAFGVARHQLRELAAIIGRLGGEGNSAR
jgi:hypothetical protein